MSYDFFKKFGYDKVAKKEYAISILEAGICFKDEWQFNEVVYHLYEEKVSVVHLVTGELKHIQNVVWDVIQHEIACNPDGWVQVISEWFSPEMEEAMLPFLPAEYRQKISYLKEEEYVM